MSRNHAGFALEDVDDAQCGHPEFELKDYAAARKLRWYGSARSPGFSQVLPKFDDYVFNAMDGILPGSGGLYGMLENELEEIELVENRGVGVGGPLYGVQYKFFGFLSRKYYFGAKNEPFEAQAAWIPATKVAIRLPQAALVPYLRVRPSDRASGHGVLDLADHGLPGFHLDGAEDWAKEPDLANAIFGGPAGQALAAMGYAYIELRLDGGVLSLQRNGFVRGDAELDRLCQEGCTIAASIREAFAPRLDPRPFVTGALPPAPWTSRDVLPTEDSSHFDLQASPSWEAYRVAAEQLGMTLESPEEYHRAFPANPAMGRARAVMRGEVDAIQGPVRLAFHTVREVLAVRGVALFAAAPDARETAPGGELIEETDQFCSVVDGVAVFWNRQSTAGDITSADLLDRSLRSARASGVVATN